MLLKPALSNHIFCLTDWHLDIKQLLFLCLTFYSPGSNDRAYCFKQSVVLCYKLKPSIWPFNRERKRLHFWHANSLITFFQMTQMTVSMLLWLHAKNIWLYCSMGIFFTNKFCFNVYPIISPDSYILIAASEMQWPIFFNHNSIQWIFS